ncbi:BglG family transcription antiterminator [Enterococcus sp. AZ072]|uniref:BglG family transcription antiterminator n=1 Tax=unclassified Enterococcus TaxID=2608891 RepID=UPI003D2D74C5
MKDETLDMLAEIVRSPGIGLGSLQKKLVLDTGKSETILKKINVLLEEHGYPPIVRKNKRLWVSLDLEELEQLEHSVETEQLYALSRKTRLILMALIIFTQKYTSLNVLANQLHVSKNTVVNDLALIKEQLVKEDIQVGYSRKTGYHFLGKEIAIRIMLIRQLHLLIDGKAQEKLLVTYTTIELTEIYQEKEKLLKLERLLHTQFSNRQLKLLCLLIPLLRVRCLNYQEISTGEYQAIIQIIAASDYQRITQAMAGANLCNEASKKEKAFLVIQLLSANVIKSRGEKMPQLGEVIDAVIERFERRSVIFFEDRKRLKQMLYQHLGPAIYRIKYGIPYEDHDIEPIIKEYQAVFPMAKQALRPLENYYQIQFTEIETVYVGLIFQSFLTKGYLMEQQQRVRAIVVCENGVSVSNLLYQTLGQCFPMIDFVCNISAREFYENPLVYEDIEVVFSTIYLRTTKKIFVVSPLLTQEDRQRLIRMVNKELYNREQGISVEDILTLVKKEVRLPDEEKLRSRLNEYFNLPKKQEQLILDSKFHRLLPEERIKVSKRQFSFNEAIQCVAEPLLKSRFIEQAFVDKIIEKYDERFPYFVIAPGVAIPHAGFNDGVNELGFSLLKLDYPVRFSNKLSAKVLLMIAPVDNYLHQTAVQAFYNCMLKEEYRQELFGLQTATEIKQFFLKNIQ